jgi:molybdopterin-guanine dinucleotide biosynthesis adapter protein
MKCFALAGVTALRKGRLIEDLIGALRIDGFTVSAVKRAPDGFDIDQPGKWSHLRREAGCGEVMLVGDRRFALLHEFGHAPAPALDLLLARLAPVDIVLLEGFRDARVPTIEVLLGDDDRPPRWPEDPTIVALVCDRRIASALPQFAPDDAAGLAAFIGGR